MTVAPTTTHPRHEAARAESTELWWLFIVTGSLWILFSLLVFRHDWTTVAAIASLIGVLCLCAAGAEAITSARVHGWSRVGHIALALAFTVIGIVAFVHPGNTFAALAAVFAFYLLLRGIFDIVTSLMSKGVELWWAGLVTGSIQIVLAFWAAGNFGNKAFLLIVWIGATALAHGVMQIVRAFQLRPAH